jgi:S1-C subfamily serine protease
VNWVDLTVIGVAVVVAILGARQGILVSLPASVMLFVGAVVGIKIAPSVVSNFDSIAGKAALSVAIPVLCAALGETIGVWFGWFLRRKIRVNKQIAYIDNTLGALVQGLMVFVVAWLFVLPLTSVPNLPGLTSEINGSKVLGFVNGIMPSEARSLPEELRNQLNIAGIPLTIGPFSTSPTTSVGTPDNSLASSAIVDQVHASVLKIRGQAPSCSRAIEGSGFVVAPQRIMTNAHVVAGTDTVQVQTSRKLLTAKVVYFDPNVDIAILDVPDLTAPVLNFDASTVSSGADGIVLGYPLDGPYTAEAAKVAAESTLPSPNIYKSQTVYRKVYTLKSLVRSGNSGGPLITPNGQVMGVVFGAAVNDSTTGFALTDAQVSNVVAQSADLTNAVSTQSCTAG